MFGAIGLGNDYMFGYGMQNACFVNPNVGNSNTCSTAQAANIAYTTGCLLALKERVQGVLNAIVGQISKLFQLQQYSELTPKEKKKIKSEIEKLQELARQVQTGLVNIPSQAQIEQIERGVQMAIQNSDAIYQKILEAHAPKEDSKSDSSADGADSADGSSDGNDSSSEGTESSEGSVKVGDIEVDPKTGRPAELGEAPKKSDIDNLCSKIFASVECSGTDHNVLDPAIKDEIDASNIIEVVKKWESGYGKHHDGDDSNASHTERNQGFFARIFDDVGDDWQRENVPHLLKALTDRAEALGMYDEIEDFASAVNKELGHSKTLGIFGGMDDHVLADNLMKIYKKIVEKEESLKKKASTQTEATKKENKKDEEKAEKENKELFLGDMREIWKDEKLEISEKVKYENGKFSIRIEGEVYSAETFKELAQDIEDAGYDPKKYLSKQKLDKKG